MANFSMAQPQPKYNVHVEFKTLAFLFLLYLFLPKNVFF